ncbi:MAG TPA: bifunctional riboflavin kinase/FAD synthetase [Chlorobaculum parvum]|uniref:Riboflavin biosynthesis protein n=1 Tax=Chlorobaculum parvum TaxID=274539 RepID=A0A7C5HA00_9CHLB|nr:bifunctional riboflavin kinase/FAD synthetase [Chlorobaculum parvum]
MRVVVLQGDTVHDADTGQVVPLKPEPSAITIGSFDGLHVGHRKIIGSMIDKARQDSLRSVVVTFDPHPRLVLERGLECQVELLTTFDEKVAHFRTMQVDLLFVIRFDREFSRKSSADFIRDVLVRMLGARQVTVGYDHGFGSDRSGSGKTLRQLGEEHGFGVEVVGEVIVDGSPVSSTRVRHLLVEGRIREANVCLGSPYIISGYVVKGNKLGRQLGFPTANIELTDRCKQLPAHGVYAARVTIGGRDWPVMMNIGRRPTVEKDGSVTVEAHIVGFSGELYGTVLVLQLLDFIRPEQRFNSIDELKAQLLVDQKKAELYLK